MILFSSSAGKGCIELHTDGDTYWFMERWRLEGQMIRSNSDWDDPYEVVKLTVRHKWIKWHSRPWLAPMLEFMVGHFGEDLFTLVALENI